MAKNYDLLIDKPTEMGTGNSRVKSLGLGLSTSCNDNNRQLLPLRDEL